MNRHSAGDPDDLEAADGARGENIEGELLDAGLARAFGSTGELPPLYGMLSHKSAVLDVDDLLEFETSGPRARLQDVDAEEAAQLFAASERYVVLREVGRGGMGLVLAALDRRIGRPVALKVLHAVPRDRARRARRFIEEAQIAGQLEHPGIVPVYDVGILEGVRPYIAMKLIEGETLATALARRRDPFDGLERFLEIIARVAQALAYAHSRGVVHRDLKPSNVLIGSFGEALVTDWGLAKIFAPRRPEDATPDVDAGAQVRTIRDSNDGDLSAAGTVLGTPAYMSPEQSRGEVDGIDARTDVFALGGMLCEVLTGGPPFPRAREPAAIGPIDETTLESVRRRLDHSNQDSSLVDLANECLRLDPGARPSHAGIVAERIEGYRSSLAGRAQQAEVAARAAREVAANERRHRRRTLALASTVVLTMAITVTIWTMQENRERDRRESGAAEAAVHGDRAEHLLVQDHLDEALLEAQRAYDVARSVPLGSETMSRVREVQDRINTAIDARRSEKERNAREAAALSAIEELRLRRFDSDSVVEIDRAYEQAFAALAASDGGVKSAVRSARRRDALCIGLFEWWALRRYAYNPSIDTYSRAVLEVLAAVDADPLRTEIRTRLEADDVEAAIERSSADLERVGAPLLSVLAMAINRTLGQERNFAFLDRATRVHPREFLLRFDRGMALTRLTPPRLEEAALDFAAADAMLDDGGRSSLNLGIVLRKLGRPREAIAALERPRRPFLQAKALAAMARAKAEGGDLDGAFDAREDLLDMGVLPSDDSLLLEVEADLFTRAGRYDDARRSLEVLIERNPDNAWARFLRSDARLRRGDEAASIEDLEYLTRIDRGNWRVHYRLGTTYFRRGRYEDAVRKLERAVTANPSNAAAQINLGQALLRNGSPEDALGHLLLGKKLGAPSGVPIDEFIRQCRDQVISDASPGD